MVGELPKLFGRAFVIGFVLPAFCIAAAVTGILYVFDAVGPAVTAFKDRDSLGAAASLFLIWLFATALLALNRPILQLISGYGKLSSSRLLMTREKRAFRALQQRVSEGRHAWDIAEKEGYSLSPMSIQTYANAQWELARDFPDHETRLLPTKFGNTLRAAEIYSVVIYGLDAAHGWPRLLAVVPAEYRLMIEDEKAQMDFWVNMWFGSCIIVACYFALAAYVHHFPVVWIPFAAIGFALLSARFARAAAQRFGILVMSAFDLFRGDLCKKLGLMQPISFEDERKMWEMLSQIWIYRSAHTAGGLTKFKLMHENSEETAAAEKTKSGKDTDFKR